MASFVPHARLDTLDFQGVVGVPYDCKDLCLATRRDFPIDALKEVKATAPEFPTPTLIPETVAPERRAGKGRVRFNTIPDEATRGVGVQGEEKWDEEMVGVPESLIRLLADADVSRREHHKHAEEHDMSCYAAGFGVMDFHSRYRSYLVSLYVEEAICIYRSVRR